MNTRDPHSTALRAPSGVRSVASLAIMLVAGLGLGGCQAIKGIFEVGFGMGAIIVLAIVAIIGGIVAMLSRK